MRVVNGECVGGILSDGLAVILRGESGPRRARKRWPRWVGGDSRVSIRRPGASPAVPFKRH